MALERIKLPVEGCLPRGAADALMREADDRVACFLEDGESRRAPRFIPSDTLSVYAALEYIRRHRLAKGLRFCEWGSGFGVITCQAFLQGFTRAVGIEIEPQLVAHARELAADFDLPVEFYCGNFVPDGCRVSCDKSNDSWELLPPAAIKENVASYSYNSWGFTPSDFDLIFAYPWPGESQMTEDLFELTAAKNTLLLTYYGIEDLNLFRKT